MPLNTKIYSLLMKNTIILILLFISAVVVGQSLTVYTMVEADYQTIVTYVNDNSLFTGTVSSIDENYYGASVKYKNFDINDGAYNDSFASSGEAIEAALTQAFLPAKYPALVENDTFQITYKTYNGQVSVRELSFLCTDVSPLTFTQVVMPTPPSDVLGNLSYGTDSTLDVITWNIEHFPKNLNVTIAKVKEAILALDAEVIAVQEIDDTVQFANMINQLDDYDYVVASSDFAALGFIYKRSTVQLKKSYMIYASDNVEFPRPPLVIDIEYEDQEYHIINNHFKCCGDGTLDTSNDSDEEYRRLRASAKLKTYIDTYHPNDAVIVVGDFNDVLEDVSANNVFQVFIDDVTNFEFADMSISQGPTSNWSYPGWPSHMDHILVTNELFDHYDCQTIKIDSLVTSAVYDADMSDHRPVGIRISPIVLEDKPVSSILLNTADYQSIVDYVNAQGLPNTSTYSNSETYYGSNANFGNFDGRDGKYNSTFLTYNDAIDEALRLVILPVYGAAFVLNDSLAVHYRIYNGNTTFDAQETYYCTGVSPLTFGSVATSIFDLYNDEDKHLNVIYHPSEKYLEMLAQASNLKIINLAGQCVFSSSQMNVNQRIDVSSFLSSVYILNGLSEDQLLSYKFIIQ